LGKHIIHVKYLYPKAKRDPYHQTFYQLSKVFQKKTILLSIEDIEI
jgi:hypothetical protein